MIPSFVYFDKDADMRRKASVFVKAAERASDCNKRYQMGFSIWPSPPSGPRANELGRHVIGGKGEEEHQEQKGTELGLCKDGIEY